MAQLRGQADRLLAELRERRRETNHAIGTARRSLDQLQAFTLNDSQVPTPTDIALREHERQHAYLVELADALRRVADPVEIQRIVAQLLGKHLGVNQAHYGETLGDVVVIEQGYGDGLPPMLGRFRHRDFGERLVATYRSGKTAVCTDVTTDRTVTAAEADVIIRAGFRAYIAVPLVKDDAWVATLAVHSIEPRLWTMGEIALVEETAMRTWAAIERARAEAALRASEQKYRAMFETVDQGFCLIELVRDDDGEICDLIFRDVNRAFEQHTGLRDVVNRTVGDVLPHFERHWIDIYTRVSRTGEPVVADNFVQDVNRWYRVHQTRVGGPGSRFVAVALDDITARKQHESALHEHDVWLSGQAQALTAAINGAPLKHSLGALVATATTALEEGVRAAFYLAAEKGAVLHHIVGMSEEYATAVDGLEIGPESLACGLATHQGASVITVDVQTDPRWEPWRSMADRFGYRGCWSFPIHSAGGAFVGTLALYWPHPRAATARELHLAALLTNTAAIIIAKHRESHDRQRAEGALRAAEERQAFLLKLSDALRPLADAAEIQAIACRLLGEYLRVDRAYYVEMDEAAGLARVEHDWVHEDAPSLAGEHRVADFKWSVHILRRGECYVVRDTQNSPLVPPADRPMCAALQIIGCMGAPLIKDGWLVGALCVTTVVPHDWSEKDAVLLREVGERLSTSIERARAEHALREREERYRTLFETINEGFVIGDLLRDEHGDPVDFLYLESNPAVDRLTAWTLEGTTGRRLSELVGAEERRYWVDAFAAIAVTRVPTRLEYFSEQLRQWYRVDASSGGGDRIVTVYANVTEEKRAEAVLRASEERQAFLLRLSDRLHPLADPVAIQREALRVLRSHLGVPRAIYAESLDQDGTMRITAESLEPGLMPIKGRVLRFADFTPEALAEALAGRPLWREDVLRDDHTPEQQAGYTELGTRSWAMIPLVKDGRLVSELTVHASEPRAWTPNELGLLQEATERTWAAVARARAEALVRESQRLRSAMLEVVPLGLAIAQPDGEVILSNPEWARFVPARRIPSADPDRTSRWRAWDGTGALVASRDYPTARALRGEHVLPGIEFLYTDDSGTEIWTRVAAVPLMDDHGETIGAVSIIDNIDDTKRAAEALRASEERQAFLLTLSDALRPLGDPEEIRLRASQVLGSHLGANRVAYAEDVGDGERFEVTRNYVEGAEDVGGRYHYADFGPDILEELAAGKVRVQTDIFNDGRLSDAQKQGLAGVGVRASLNVPLVKNGALVAFIGVNYSTAHDFTAGEIALVQEVAERTWVAVELARFTRRTEAFNTFLVDFSESVRGLMDPSVVAHTACRLLAEALAVERAYWAEVDWSTREYVIGASFHLPGVPVIDGRFPVDAWEPFTSVHLAGRAVVVDNTQADPRIPAAMKAAYAQIAVGADLAVPIAVDGQLRCTLTVNQRVARRWRDDEIALVHGIAARCWAEVERVRAEQRLQRAHDSLEQRVRERTTQVHELFQRLVSVQEEERRRIARDIHDQIGQQVTALRLHIDILRAKSGSNHIVIEEADRTQRLAEELDQSIDFLTWDLRPAALEHLGLSAALDTLVSGWSDRFGIRVDFSGTDRDRPRLPADAEVNLYRVTQEALHNIAKHAQATHVSVRLEQDDDEIRLVVADNGRGFDAQRIDSEGMGLISMRERVALIGGELEIQSRDNMGTSVLVRVPFRAFAASSPHDETDTGGGARQL